MTELHTIQRAEQRFRTDDVNDGTVTYHSFSFGRHYDPSRIGFGPVMAINEERLEPGAGYAEHHHADVEIVTWVLDGVLEHRDSTGTHGLIHPGTLQRLSAGPGVSHAETNASQDRPVSFLQLMLRSSHEGAPEYAQHDVTGSRGEMATNGPAVVSVLRAGRHTVHTPALVHVTSGEVMIGIDVLGPGDELHAGSEGPLDVTVLDDAEALVVTTDRTRGALA